jgi:hypothetical protein
MKPASMMKGPARPVADGQFLADMPAGQTLQGQGHDLSCSRPLSAATSRDRLSGTTAAGERSVKSRRNAS